MKLEKAIVLLFLLTMLLLFLTVLCIVFGMTTRNGVPNLGMYLFGGAGGISGTLMFIAMGWDIYRSKI